jgi:predicted GNAT family acetyltransferase
MPDSDINQPASVGDVDETFTPCGFNAAMKVSADALVTAMAGFFQELILSIPGATLLRRDGVVAALTGVPLPMLNPVLLERPDPAMADVASLLDEVALRELPFAVGLRPRSGKALAEFVASGGLMAVEEVPLMAVDTAKEIRSPAELSIRLLAPDEAPVHTRLWTTGFGMPAGVTERIVTEDTLKSSAVRCYVGEIAGQPVATALTATVGGFTGIVNVTTDPHYRGRGFGTAITRRAVSDGLAAGAAWCWLQSTPHGYPVYESLGFQLIESWPVWVSRQR